MNFRLVHVDVLQEATRTSVDNFNLLEHKIIFI